MPRPGPVASILVQVIDELVKATAIDAAIAAKWRAFVNDEEAVLADSPVGREP